MYLLENEYLLAAFDDKARLVRLENKALGYNAINRPAADSFRLVAKIGENWENIIFAHEQTFVGAGYADILHGMYMGPEAETETICLQPQDIAFMAFDVEPKA